MHSFHTVYKIIRFKVEKKGSFPQLKGYNRVFGGQKTIFYNRYGLRDLKFLFLG
jgi:hypothetical protein